MSRPGYVATASSSSIIPTSHPPPAPQRATTLRRGKTLTRPERQVAQAPLITPPAPLPPGHKPSFPYASPAVAANTNTINWDWWVITSLVCTFWAPIPVLRSCGMTDSAVRQAWREKVTLCTICIVMGGVVAFLTMGLDKALCPDSASRTASSLRPVGGTPGKLYFKTCYQVMQWLIMLGKSRNLLVKKWPVPKMEGIYSLLIIISTCAILADYPSYPSYPDTRYCWNSGLGFQHLNIDDHVERRLLQNRQWAFGPRYDEPLSPTSL